MWSPCLIRSRRPEGRVDVRLGHPVVDDYLEFAAARCRPNTVLAAGYDLKVFFSIVEKDPVEVTSADVLAFIKAQRAAGDPNVIRLADGESGLSSRTIQRRLSCCRRCTRICSPAAMWQRTRCRRDCRPDGPEIAAAGVCR